MKIGLNTHSYGPGGPHTAILEFGRKQFPDGNFNHAFTVADAEFPLEDDAKKAMQVLTDSSADGMSCEIQAENRHTARNLLRSWDVRIDIMVNDTPRIHLIKRIV